VCCSDHLEPWWTPGAPTPAACGNAWVWLGAAGHATRRVALGAQRRSGGLRHDAEDDTIVSADPADHARKIRLIGQMGATAVVMNVSGPDGLGMIRTYGEHVLPELRDR
jgi:alkanesulfonate monooxygenase SsuD/methylene tetrahydromethanopterin reductase-like flavin-dependent oxidoreductase (luciferase family)